MDPLIIVSNHPTQPNPTAPDIVDRLVEDSISAYKAGAAIQHIHLVPAGSRVPGQRPRMDIARSVEVIKKIRQNTDMIINFGTTISNQEDRLEICRQATPDLLSITPADNDTPGMLSVHRTQDDMEKEVALSQELGFKMEWEIFHAGAAWNLRYFINKGMAQPPHWCNVMLYSEGSCWSPQAATTVDYLVSTLPEHSMYHICTASRPDAKRLVPQIDEDEHTRLMTYAIIKGGHVRIGKEDRPNLRPGVPMKAQGEAVKQIADISRLLGREIATPEQARKMLGLPKRPKRS